VTSEELAKEVEDAIRACTGRILGTGATQYEIDHDTQQFELLPPAELIQWFEEEFEDIVNYAVMTRIRLRQLRREIEEDGTNE